MMPGVVAGFPAKPNNEVFVVAAVYSASAVFEEGSEGYLSVPHKNIQVGAPDLAGAAGEIVRLEHNTNTYHFTLSVRGNYASLADVPFTKITVGAVDLIKSAHFFWDVMDLGDHFRTRVIWNMPPPLVIGTSPVRVLITP